MRVNLVYGGLIMIPSRILRIFYLLWQRFALLYIYMYNVVDMSCRYWEAQYAYLADCVGAVMALSCYWEAKYAYLADCVGAAMALSCSACIGAAMALS